MEYLFLHKKIVATTELELESSHVNWLLTHKSSSKATQQNTESPQYSLTFAAIHSSHQTRKESKIQPMLNQKQAVHRNYHPNYSDNPFSRWIFQGAEGNIHIIDGCRSSMKNRNYKNVPKNNPRNESRKMNSMNKTTVHQRNSMFKMAREYKQIENGTRKNI